MKLFATLLLSTFAMTSIGQQFKVESSPRIIYSESFKSNPQQAIITPTNKLIYCSDNVEIVDLPTGELLYSWDPKGGYGESFISDDGKYVANRSQNYEHPTLGYVDAFQVLNTETKKEYLSPVPDELWQKFGFANTKEEIVIQSYKYDGTDDKVRIMTYDFVNGKEIKTLFKSSKSSTIIMNLAYSLDDKYIYANIAFSSSVSTFYVFNTVTGDVVKKINLPYQCEKMFVREGKIILSGAHGINTIEYTTILSSKDFSEMKEWKNEYTFNVDPKGLYAIKYDWETKNLYVFDLITGKESLLMEGSEYNFYIVASSFDLDGNYFAIAKENSYEYYQSHKDEKRHPRVYILDNSLIDNPTGTVESHEEEETSVNSTVDETTTSNSAWISYTLSNPKLDIKLPGEATVKEDKTSKGARTVTITGATKTEAGVVSLVEIPNIKTSKYTSTAQKLGESYFKNKTPENLKKSTYSYRGQEGLEYTFKLGSFEYIYRVFCFNGYAFQLFYLASDIGNSDYNTFFESFDLK